MSTNDDWVPDRRFAKFIGKTTRTLREWRRKKIGPPYAFMGRTPHYRLSARAEYLSRTERHPKSR